MTLQLTPEQEHSLQTVVDSGAYPTVQAALDAALAVLEAAPVPGFDGTYEELECLLLEGMDSGEAIPVDDAFWHSLTVETDTLMAQHQAGKPGERKSRLCPVPALT